MLVSNEDVYVRTFNNCYELNPADGEYITEYLGVDHGHSEQISIALVKIVPNHSSLAHYHKNREEAYIIISGIATLVVDEVERVLKPGDIAHIPQGAVHQIFNKGQEDLIFNCICAPAWIYQDYNLDLESIKQKEKALSFVKSETEVQSETDGHTRVCKLLGHEEECGKARKIQVSLREIFAQKAYLGVPSKADGCFIIKKGEGCLEINGKKINVERGQMVKIPAEQEARLANIGNETLKLYEIHAII